MRSWKVHNIHQALAVLGLWVQFCRCQSDAPSANNFRWRTLQSVAVLDNYLYIDGGEVAQYEDGKDDILPSQPTNSTLSIDLTQPWTPADASINIIHKGPSPTVKTPALWPDARSGVMYSYSGEGFWPNKTAAENIHIWKFTPDGKGSGSWAAGKAPDGNIHTGTSGTSVVCAGRGFLLGGYGTAASDSWFKDDLPQPGLLIYDFNTSLWKNVTAPDPYSPHLHGQAACLPFGTQGLVSFFGGAQMAKPMVKDSITKLEYVPFDNLTFYDPITEKWFWQITTGDIPETRQRYCAVGAAGPNNTYEIFVYGGITPLGPVLSDIHVLSIPAFRWFRAPTDFNPRVDHRCAIAGNRQMIAVGGHQQTDDPGPGDLVDRAQDPWRQGLAVFDMSALVWTNTYDPVAAAYDSPDDINSWYISNNLSSVSWTNDQVKNIFYNANLTYPSTLTDTKRHSSATPVGAIAGGVVGGIALVAILAGGVYLWRRRRGRRPGISELGTQSSAPENSSTSEPEIRAGYQLVNPQEMPVPMEEPGSKYLVSTSSSEQGLRKVHHELP